MYKTSHHSPCAHRLPTTASFVTALQAALLSAALSPSCPGRNRYVSNEKDIPFQ